MFLKDKIYTAADVEFFDEFGYVTIRQLIDPAKLQTIREHVEEFFSGKRHAERVHCGPGSRESPDDPGRNIYQLIVNEFPLTDPILAEFSENEILATTARQLMKSTCATCFSVQVIAKEPGESNATPFHQDEDYWQFGRHGERGVSAWLPLAPTTAEGGTLFILPESHKWGLLNHHAAGGVSRFRALDSQIDRSQLIPLEMEPGDVSFHDYRIIHGSFDNEGTTRRISLSQHYHSHPDRSAPFQPLGE